MTRETTFQVNSPPFSLSVGDNDNNHDDNDDDDDDEDMVFSFSSSFFCLFLNETEEDDAFAISLAPSKPSTASVGPAALSASAPARTITTTCRDGFASESASTSLRPPCDATLLAHIWLPPLQWLSEEKYWKEEASPGEGEKELGGKNPTKLLN
jgi:hypothetical protein